MKTWETQEAKIGVCIAEGCKNETLMNKSHCQEHFDMLYDRLATKANEDQLRQDSIPNSNEQIIKELQGILNKFHDPKFHTLEHPDKGTLILNGEEITTIEEQWGAVYAIEHCLKLLGKLPDPSKTFEIKPEELYNKVREALNNKVEDSDFISYYCQQVIKLMSYQILEDSALKLIISIRKTVIDEVVGNIYAKKGER